jgi:hypothetical protein
MNNINRIFQRLHYLLFLTLFLITISCEEVINIDLKSASPFLVAEGLIEQDSTGWVRLSYTTDYFNSQETQFVEYATVKLMDDSDNSETLNYQGNGLYRGASMTGRANREYTINISGQDFNLHATSKLFASTQIYSVDFEVLDIQRPGEIKELYTARLKFRDNLYTENYYMVKFWKNGIPENNGYTLIRDSYYSSGDTIEYSTWRNTFEPGDTVNIRLYSIDRDFYAYYSQLNDISETGMGGYSTPYNPKSNFGPAVMGYFGASSFTSVTSVVK